MRSDQVKIDAASLHSGRPISRRAFIAGTAAATWIPGVAAAIQLQRDDEPAPPTASRETHPPVDRLSRTVEQPAARSTRPWWMSAADARPKVVEVRSRRVLSGSRIDEAVLERMIGEGVRLFTGAPTPDQAWRRILSDARRILLKFNSADAAILETNPAFATALVGSLAAAGYAPDILTITEIAQDHCTRLGVASPRVAWADSVQVGGSPMQLARYFTEADAVINVGLLKWHHIATFSGASINLSHGIVRHPARMHSNGCTPFVGDVLSDENVSAKVRLNIVNAIRCIVDKGADARREDVSSYGGMFMGADPGAVDSIGVVALQAERRKARLSHDFAVPYLQDMASRGICRIQLEAIDQSINEVD